ncbi:small-subunit processome [Phlyctochytrium arcticum]|nr:small-subunit processome [Phlyctochytrium arcticum]
MSSLRNAVQRRNHKERSQTSSRSHLGLLEKHKDYVLRARDYHRKQNALKTLRSKATTRNPDEFYFGMINAKTKKGVHVAERGEKFTHEVLQLLKTQDQGYVQYQKSVNKKKIERLRGELHMLDDGGEDEGESEDDMMDLEEGSSKRKPNHTIFVDDVSEARSFDPAKHFDTPAELLSRKFNRPTTQLLESTLPTPPDPHTQKKLDKKRELAYRELASRLERDEKLLHTSQEMDLQKALMGKGEKKKVGVDSKGKPIYKWKAQRKR